ncbi:hypothetical protein ACIBCT_31805 [Streptosporangium sp. NPDC050855]|uniref:hypothetical protein n=1 Tax=Streptosporangium sp. NPDC050855 TaxID=3366194 RepID=UPI0037B8F99F
MEADLERMRAEVAEMRRQVGDVGPTDPTEQSMMINQADEQEVLIASLDARREELLKRLREE